MAGRDHESVKFVDLGLKWKIGVVWMLAALGANLYFAFTKSGLFPQVVGFQRRMIGIEFSSLTFLVCLVPLLVPLFIVRGVLVRVLRALGVRDPDMPEAGDAKRPWSRRG